MQGLHERSTGGTDLSQRWSCTAPIRPFEVEAKLLPGVAPCEQNKHCYEHTTEKSGAANCFQCFVFPIPVMIAFIILLCLLYLDDSEMKQKFKFVNFCHSSAYFINTFHSKCPHSSLSSKKGASVSCLE